MKKDYNEMVEDMAEYVEKYAEIKNDDPEDVAYYLAEESQDFDDQGKKLFDHLVRLKLIEEIEVVEKVDDLKLGDLYGFDVKEIHSQIRKDVYKKVLD